MLSKYVRILQVITFICAICNWMPASAEVSDPLSALKNAYPDLIQSVFDTEVIWRDGTRMPLHDDKPNKTPQEILNNPFLKL